MSGVLTLELRTLRKIVTTAFNDTIQQGSSGWVENPMDLIYDMMSVATLHPLCVQSNTITRLVRELGYDEVERALYAAGCAVIEHACAVFGLEYIEGHTTQFRMDNHHVYIGY